MTPLIRCRGCDAECSTTTLGGLCPACTARLTFGFEAQDELEGRGEGEVFGDYRLLNEIARGGMGVVFRARQESLGRTVAIKMILSGRFASDEHVQRFRAEAEAAAGLRHPNIIAIHEVGELEGQHYFSMDYVRGGNLSGLVEDRPLAPVRAAALVRTIAEAVQYAHDRGIIHRDLKPSNILLDDQDVPHITDFGLAKRLLDSSTSGTARLPDLTISGQVVGSPNFAAPEQVAGRSRHAGPLADVYSLGAILYYLVTGRPPFLAENLDGTLAMVLNEEPVAPRLLNAGLPRDLDTIVLKCLAKEPARRYPSARALADELDRFHTGQPIHARPVGRLQRSWRWARRNPLSAGLGLAAGILLWAGFSGVLWQWGRAEHNAQAETEQRRRAEGHLSALRLQYAEARLERGEAAEGLAFLAQVLREDPENRTAAERLLSVLTRRSFALPDVAPLVHEAMVHLAEFSPDGKRLLTASEDGTARVWDSVTGVPLTEPLRHPGPVTLAQFRPQGDRLLTVSGRVVREWAPSTGAHAGGVLRHKAEVVAAEYHPSQERLMTATRNGEVCLWASARKSLWPQPLWKIEVEDRVGAARFGGNGRLVLVTRDRAKKIEIYDSENGTLIREFEIGWRIEDAEIGPRGERLAVIGYTAWTRVYEIESGEILFEFPLRDLGNDLEFSPDGELLAVAGRFNPRLAIWDLTTGAMVREFAGHKTWVTGVEFSSDGQRVLSIEEGKLAHVWDLLTGKPVVEPLRLPHKVESARFDPGGDRVVAATGSRAEVWDVRPGAGGWMPLISPGYLWGARFSGDGTRAIIFDTDGHTSVWDPLSGEQLYQTTFPTVVEAALDPTGKIALVGFWQRASTPEGDCAGMLWNLETDQKYPLDHQARIVCVNFTPDGKRFATACFDGTARVWDTGSAKPLTPLLRHPRKLWHAEFDPEGKRLVTAGNATQGSGGAWIWDAATGKLLTPPLDHPGDVVHAMFSPDGTKVIAACSENTATVWDASTGTILHNLTHDSAIRSVGFDQSGSRALSASQDNTARVWNADSGMPITTPLRHSSEIYVAEFCPRREHSDLLLTGSFDGTVRLWEARNGNPRSDPFQHYRRVQTAEFHPDRNLLLAGAAHARVWEIPDLREGIPPWLSGLGEAVAGMRRGDDGIVPLSGDPLLALRNRLAEQAEPSSSGQAPSWVEQWGRWFFADRDERPISPAFDMTHSEFRERLAGDPRTYECVLERVRRRPAEAAGWAALAAMNPPYGWGSEAGLRRYASRRAVILEPESLKNWQIRLKMLSKLHDPKETAICAREALKHHPGHTGLLRVLGQSLGELGEIAAAGEAYQRALDSASSRLDREYVKSADSWRDLLRKAGRPEQAQRDWLKHKGIPPRPSDCPAECVDLSPVYNTTLDEPWHNRGWKGNDLAMLIDPSTPAAVIRGVPFDVRGLVQVNSIAQEEMEPGFASEVTGIAIERPCERLHFLHAAGWGYHVQAGTVVGHYRVSYADGRVMEIPLRAAENIHGWHAVIPDRGDLPRARLVDLGANRGGATVGLFHFTWENPHPEVAIKRIALHSTMTRAAPFLVALTLAE